MGGLPIPPADARRPLDSFDRGDCERILLASLGVPDEYYAARPTAPGFNHAHAAWEALAPIRAEGGVNNALLVGESAAGKTWAVLATAVALVAFEAREHPSHGGPLITPHRGVVYAHAVALFDDRDLQAAARAADILVIDDLGCEPSRGVKAEDFMAYLQLLIHDRLGASDRHTFITSNLRLTRDQFLARYGDRIKTRMRRSGIALDVSGAAPPPTCSRQQLAERKE